MRRFFGDGLILTLGLPLVTDGGAWSDAPARGLFGNFDGQSRLVTLAHCKDHFNVPVTPDFLIPVDRVLEADAARPPMATPAGRRKSVRLADYRSGEFLSDAGARNVDFPHRETTSCLPNPDAGG